MFFSVLSGCATTPQIEDALTSEEKQLKVASLLRQAENEFQQRNLPSALLRYEQVLEYDAGNRLARIGAANTARDLGNYDKALEYFDMLLVHDVNDIDAQEGKALTFFKAGDYRKARQQLSAVINSDNKRWRSLNALGVLEDLEGSYTVSADYYHRALEVEPNNVLIMNNLGYSLIMAH